MGKELFTHDIFADGLETEPHYSVIDSDSVLDAAKTSTQPCGPLAEVWLDMKTFTWVVHVFLRDFEAEVTEEQEKVMQLKLEEVVGSCLT